MRRAGSRPLPQPVTEAALAPKSRSDGLALAMFVVIAVTHVGTNLLAKQFGIDRAWLFYILVGVQGVFLYGLWLKHSPAVATVALWGLIESGMTSVCGSLAYFKPIEPAEWEGMCDAKLGFPIFHWFGLIAAALLALSFALRWRRNV